MLRESDFSSFRRQTTRLRAGKGPELLDIEFLDAYGHTASVAAHVLNDEWLPDYDCDDHAREQHEYFLSTGELNQLVFDGGAVYHDELVAW